MRPFHTSMGILPLSNGFAPLRPSSLDANNERRPECRRRPSSRLRSEAAMNDADVPIGQRNPWLLGYAALVGTSTLLWSMWWPPARPPATAPTREVQHSATVIDLAPWRRRPARAGSRTSHY